MVLVESALGALDVALDVVDFQDDILVRLLATYDLLFELVPQVLWVSEGELGQLVLAQVAFHRWGESKKAHIVCLWSTLGERGRGCLYFDLVVMHGLHITCIFNYHHSLLFVLPGLLEICNAILIDFAVVTLGELG